MTKSYSNNHYTPHIFHFLGYEDFTKDCDSMRHQTMDSPGLLVPVNEIDPILAKIISTNLPEN